jgi:hypothetical protein
MTDAVKLGDLDGMDLPDFTAQAVVVPKGSVSTFSTSGSFFTQDPANSHFRCEFVTEN